jgi:phenylalanyl-tRNA synthetase beta chain
MNILVSYNWLKERLKTDLTPEEFAARVSLCGPSVERIHRQEQSFAHIFVGKILGVEKHPNADKLRIAEVDLGNRKLKLVCGGSNLQGGMKVAVALEGAKVKWHGERDLIELKPAEIRGVKSEGMICAAAEIGLADAFPAKNDHEIMDLSDLPIKSGTPLGEALGGTDAILDIEVTTNRPDAMCIFGIAREAGTILKAPFAPPAILPIKKAPVKMNLTVKNDAPDLCSRYQAVAITGVKVAPSPWWLKRKLISLGCRPINNVVDITNFILWEMGQPLHAFDYDKLNGKKIIVRRAKQNEKIKALDGNEYKLKESNLVVADGKEPAAIAGVMGGEATGVTDGTTTIVLEAATFDPVSVRRTARDLNLRSDSSNLFEKGLSTENTKPALSRAAQLILELCGGTVAGEVFDLREKKYKPLSVSMSIAKANKVIGADLDAGEIVDILKRLGFDILVKGDTVKAAVPFWRDHDIEIEEDLIEEVARIYGYHRLPSLLPAGAPPLGKKEKDVDLFYWERAARNLATSSGYDEILSYAMIGNKIMDAAGESKAVKIANPLSVDLEYMRTCLFPGLLQTIAENQNNFSAGKIFELGRAYAPTKKSDLPNEATHFSGMIWNNNAVIANEAKQSRDAALFYNAKGFAEKFLERFGLSGCIFKDGDDKNFHPARATDIYLPIVKKNKKEEIYIGSFGEIHPGTAKNFGIDGRVGFFYFYLDTAAQYAKTHKSYSPLAEYPGIKRDISFVADGKTEYEKIKSALMSLDSLIADIEVFDVYEGAGVPEGKKSMALHLLFRAKDRTLKTAETDAVWERVVALLKKEFSAEVRI